MAGYRVSRVSEDIRREITAIVRELKDPRVKDRLLTVVRVEVSSDASYAKVFISDMAGIESARQAVAALTAATGYIRLEVGTRLHLRKTPEMKFVADDSVEKGIEMFKKLSDSEGGGSENGN